MNNKQKLWLKKMVEMLINEKNKNLLPDNTIKLSKITIDEIINEFQSLLSCMSKQPVKYES